MTMRFGVGIPLRDGVELNATLYLPEDGSAPGPALFTLTPYVGQTYHDRGIYFAAHGYPFLTVDVRGRGNSGGAFEPFVNEAEDAFDVVEWLAREPYCDGRVAMWGGSYGGFVQWAAAKERPPHLVTIVPVASPFLGVDIPGRSNIPMPYLMQWLTLVWGRASQDKLFWNNSRFWNGQFRQWFESGAPFKTVDRQLGAPSITFQEWMSHPRQDSYWDRCNPTAQQYSQLSIPILTITGIYDADQPGALSHYREHLRHSAAGSRPPHYLVIGPWDHAGTRVPSRTFSGLEVGEESLVDLAQLHLDWYAWTMQGGPKPEFLRDAVAYYVMVADTWRYAETLDAVTARVQPLYLTSAGNPSDVFKSGSLSECLQSAGDPDWYVYDPRDVSLAELESSVDPYDVTDQRMIHARAAGKQLIYHTAPVAGDTEVSGFFRLRVWFAIDQADTDFVADIHEIGLDGNSVLLARDLLRARYRQSLREEQFVTTADPIEYVFDRFTFVSRLIRRGHRLRLAIGPLDSIYSQKNYNSGGVVAEESIADARTVTARLFHDATHPSVLYVPLGHYNDSTAG